MAPIAHHPDRRLVPVEVRPDVGTTLAAGRADEARLDVAQPEIIGPAVAAGRDSGSPRSRSGCRERLARASRRR